VLYRDFATQEELDAQYALERVVPDAASYAEFYARESEKARGELVHRSRVPYGPTLAEHADVFPAPGMEPARGASVLVYLHGGYWRRFSSEDFSFVARDPASRGWRRWSSTTPCVPRLRSGRSYARPAPPVVDLRERRELRRRPGACPRRRALGGRATRRDAAPYGLGGRVRVAAGRDQGRVRDRRPHRSCALPLHFPSAQTPAHLERGPEEQPDPAPPRRRPATARRLRLKRDRRVQAPVRGVLRRLEGEGSPGQSAAAPRQTPLRRRGRLPRRPEPSLLGDPQTDGHRVESSP
jgi:hypothetical protein